MLKNFYQVHFFGAAHPLPMVLKGKYMLKFGEGTPVWLHTCIIIGLIIKLAVS